MQDEGTAAASRHRVDEAVETLLGVLVVDADAAFNRDGDIGLRAASLRSVRDKLWLCHETSAEPSRLHPVRRAADIEVDFVIAKLGTDARGLGKSFRIAAADL